MAARKTCPELPGGAPTTPCDKPPWHRGQRLKHVRVALPGGRMGRLYCYYRSKVRAGYEPYRGYRGTWCPKCHRPSDRYHSWEDWRFLLGRQLRREARRRLERERRRLERWRLGRMTSAERRARKALLEGLRRRRA